MWWLCIVKLSEREPNGLIILPSMTALAEVEHWDAPFSGRSCSMLVHTVQDYQSMHSVNEQQLTLPSMPAKPEQQTSASCHTNEAGASFAIPAPMHKYSLWWWSCLQCNQWAPVGRDPHQAGAGSGAALEEAAPGRQSWQVSAGRACWTASSCLPLGLTSGGNPALHLCLLGKPSAWAQLASQHRWTPACTRVDWPLQCA